MGQTIKTLRASLIIHYKLSLKGTLAVKVALHVDQVPHTTGKSSQHPQ